MEPNEQELRTLARKRVQARVGFIVHLMMYAAVNAGLIFIWAFSNRGYPWFIWPLVCWGAAVLAHGVTLAVGPDSRGEERAIEREIERLRIRVQPR